MYYFVLNYSLTHGDGISQVVRRLLENFSPIFRKKVVIICNDIKHPADFYFEGTRCINIKTKSFFIFDVLFLYSRLLYSYKIYKYLKKNIDNGDIVNIHEGAGITFFTALLKNKIRKKFKIIITLHGSSFCLYSDIAKRLPSSKFTIKIALRIWRWYIWIIENEILKRGDYYIFITQKTAKYCQDIYKFNNQYTIIPNGLDNSKRIKKSGEEFSSKVLNAIIVGSRTYVKGLDIAIKALKDINKEDLYVRLNVIGFKDFNHYYKKNIPPYINYVGVVNPSKMASWYQQSDFMLFPSRWEEPPSLVVLEALQHGLPFIVSVACVKNEIDGFENMGYVVDDYSISKWVKTIKLMFKKENYEKFRKNIEQKNLSPYDWKEQSNKYERLFNEMLKGFN